MNARIYALVDPITNKIRYIGQTRKEIEERAYHHWRDRNQPKNKGNHKASWISKLQREYKVKPVVILIEEIPNCNDDLLNIREKYWIKYYRSKGFDLTNTSDEDYFYVHNKKKGCYKKTIYCYDKNFNLQVFESARQASQILNIDYKKISENAKGKYCNIDFTFSFIELTIQDIEIKFTPLKLSYVKVKSIDKINGEERIFKNQLEASKFFQCNFRNINFVLKGIRKSCANQYWEYVK